MKFSNTSERDEGVRLSRGERHTRIHKGIVFTDEAILWFAESLYRASDRNPNASGFAGWTDLTDHVKAHWIRNAQDWLQAIMDKTQLLDSPFSGIPGLKPVDPADLVEYERAMREEAIPAMVKEHQENQRRAHESRQRWMG